ncbi:MAG: dihydroorotate dehydrogenase electron transfer subunit [Treponema sp.]|jgi:dihydroorotate dehydrogenase electron transfer subunit|nr:dihydroorotate dehydrogenase electron transfer subunit [Treponema sp.]
MKQYTLCETVENTALSGKIFQIAFVWKGEKPQAGQFFLIKPKVSSVFLARPISVAWADAETLTFLIAHKGIGAEELSLLREGEKAYLTGPLGNSWSSFLNGLSSAEKIALVGGGLGIAPLLGFAFLLKDLGRAFDFFAGFQTALPLDWRGLEPFVVTEYGATDRKGLVTDFLRPEQYGTVFACGSFPMLKVIAKSCRAQGTPCVVSMEKRMACGVGACLGCAVETVNGYRRCCSDGPIFRAEEIFYVEQLNYTKLA